MKLDSRGTQTVRDDRLLPGASFDLYRDDGDGAFEPTAGDPRVEYRGLTVHAFLVTLTPDEGSYWVSESRAPSGYELAPAELAPDLTSHEGQNCIVFKGHVRCLADDDGVSGFVLVVISDDPATLPPTDTADSDSRMEVVPVITTLTMARRMPRYAAHGSPQQPR